MSDTAIEALKYSEFPNSSDCISRQAAIEWCLEGLNNMPSAQPEIIRCKECKHFHYDMPYVIQGVPVLGHEVCDAWGDGCKTDENGYCFLAEKMEGDEG